MKVIIIFLLLIGLSISLNNQDYSTLVDLYDSTNGIYWKNKWDLSNSNYCLYYGITCDYSDNSYIIKIELNNNNLSGILPELINNLKNLNYLILKNNNLSGDLPNLDIQKLFYLDLSYNKYEGIFSSTSRNIRYLILNDNNISMVSLINDNFYYYLDIMNNNLKNVNIRNTLNLNLTINSNEIENVNCYNCILNFKNYKEIKSNIISEEANYTTILNSSIKNITIINNRYCYSGNCYKYNGKRFNVINSDINKSVIDKVNDILLYKANIFNMTIYNYYNFYMEETIIDDIQLYYGYNNIYLNWILINNEFKIQQEPYNNYGWDKKCYTAHEISINNSNINNLNFYHSYCSYYGSPIKNLKIYNSYIKNMNIIEIDSIIINKSIISNYMLKNAFNNISIKNLTVVNSNIIIDINDLFAYIPYPQTDSDRRYYYGNQNKRILNLSNNGIYGILRIIPHNTCINLQDNNITVNLNNNYQIISRYDSRFSLKCDFDKYLKNNTIIIFCSNESIVLL